MQKWEYLRFTCMWKTTSRGVPLLSPGKGEWVVNTGKDTVKVDELLELLGEEGYELVSAYPSQLRSGGQGPGWYSPDIHYVLKRPKE